MTITQEFREAVNDKDTRMVRIMLKNSLVVDPTFAEFNQMNALAEANIDVLYDEHDGEVLESDTTTWTKDYMDEQMVQVVYNFSKERINLLKSICSHLYKERADQIKKDRKAPEPQIQITKKQVGTALVVGGVVTVAVGVVLTKAAIVATGVAVGIVGGVLIITDK